jgi:predicted O-methyltransferase YrrM
MNIGRKLQRWIGRRLAATMPERVTRALVVELCARDVQRQTAIGAVARHVKAQATDLDRMEWDLALDGDLGFEHFAGLFSSTTLDEAIISMNVRQAAYLFGLVRRMDARTVIEIGRYKGGTTLLIAAAMRGRGRFWSVDIAGLDPHLRPRTVRPVETQIAELCRRLGLSVDLIVGDSRTVEIETGEVDLVFIDGDHSYEGAKSDFERFGRRVRVGGAVLFDDAFDDGFFHVIHTDGVGPVVEEILQAGDFRLVRTVKRLAHLERVR